MVHSNFTVVESRKSVAAVAPEPRLEREWGYFGLEEAVVPRSKDQEAFGNFELRNGR